MKRVFYTVSRGSTKDHLFKDYPGESIDAFDVWLELQRDHRSPFIKIEEVVDL